MMLGDVGAEQEKSAGPGHEHLAFHGKERELQF